MKTEPTTKNARQPSDWVVLREIECAKRALGSERFERERSKIVIKQTPGGEWKWTLGKSVQCCERDHNHDGNCDVHSAPGVERPHR